MVGQQLKQKNQGLYRNVVDLISTHLITLECLHWPMIKT